MALDKIHKRHALSIEIIVVFLILVSAAQGAAPSEQWSKTFGGQGEDSAWSVLQTSDGGYIITALTSSKGDDAWLIKTDANGNKIWDKTFGGERQDMLSSFLPTSDDGFILAGYYGVVDCVYGSGGANPKPGTLNCWDVWIVKTDANGNKIWDKTFDKLNYDHGWSIQETSDSGYIIAGDTVSDGTGNGDAWLIKLDNAGNKIWDKIFGGTDYDYARAILQTSDGGYIFAGETQSYGAGSSDAWLIKTDSNGNKIWEKTFGGTNADRGQSIVSTSDGGYIIVGSTNSYGAGKEDAWVFKIDSNGNKIWEKTFGDTSRDAAWSVQRLDDGYIIIAGWISDPIKLKKDTWLIKLDTNGNKVCDKVFGGVNDESAHSVIQTSDGGFAIVGRTYSYGAGAGDAWLVKFSAEALPTSTSTPTPTPTITTTPLPTTLTPTQTYTPTPTQTPTFTPTDTPTPTATQITTPAPTTTSQIEQEVKELKERLNKTEEKQSQQESRISWLESAINSILDWLKSIF